jgi:hypothetical protein
MGWMRYVSSRSCEKFVKKYWPKEVKRIRYVNRIRPTHVILLIMACLTTA